MEIYSQILVNKITDPFLDVYTDGTKVALYHAPPNSFQNDRYSKRMIIRCLSRLGKFKQARRRLASYKGELKDESYQKMENYISKWEAKINK